MTAITIECAFRISGRDEGRKQPLEGKAEQTTEPGRVPRIARLMALAIRYDGLIRSGKAESYAELARRGNVSRTRISQIVNLRNLAPDIQEAILFLPRADRGQMSIILADLQPIAAVADWGRQRRMWAVFLARAAK